MKRVRLYFLSIVFLFPSCSVIQNFALEPTQLETITALKEVLNSSTFRAIATLRGLHNEGMEALLPEEIKPVFAKLKSIGLGDEIESVTAQIKSTSGIALSESQGILTDAIKELSFEDAVAVVVGGENAATQVLKNAMYISVKKRYSSKLEMELQKTDVNTYWPMAVSAYNLFADEKIDSNLPDFLAERAVDALFLTMGHEESEIRKDPASLGKAVVTKVFDYYKNKSAQ